MVVHEMPPCNPECRHYNTDEGKSGRDHDRTYFPQRCPVTYFVCVVAYCLADADNGDDNTDNDNKVEQMHFLGGDSFVMLDDIGSAGYAEKSNVLRIVASYREK
jgi:hypothetical protein